MTEETGRDWVPKVELPTGGGAIPPVGEKVEAIAFTGSAAYQIPIPRPRHAGTRSRSSR